MPVQKTESANLYPKNLQTRHPVAVMEAFHQEWEDLGKGAVELREWSMSWVWSTKP